MPFLTLPARPFKKSATDWLFYFSSMLLMAFLLVFLLWNYNTHQLFSNTWQTFITIFCLLITGVVFLLFAKHPYLFFLYLLAIPTKISLLLSKYRPAKGFLQLHADTIKNLKTSNGPLKILDISTGTGNSLYRHGWMNLQGEYTGLDLSETMLSQCQAIFSERKIPIDLVIADASILPFRDGYFDVVLNYGAINGYHDIRAALSEMARVTKQGGLILFLDEQLYPGASFIEKLYFRLVLSSHNIIHHCPVEFLPDNVSNVQVNQVYEFYYTCTCNKN